MALPVLMPRFDPDGTPGVVIEWRVRTGTAVDEGEVLAHVECNKSILPIEAHAPGILLRRYAEAGEARRPYELLGLLGEEQEDCAAWDARAERERRAAPRSGRGRHNGRSRQ